jgi:hypothetical protein
MKTTKYLPAAFALMLLFASVGCATQKTYIGAGSGSNAPLSQSMKDRFVKTCMDQKAAAESKGLTCHPRPRDGYVVT